MDIPLLHTMDTNSGPVWAWTIENHTATGQLATPTKFIAHHESASCTIFDYFARIRVHACLRAISKVTPGPRIAFFGRSLITNTLKLKWLWLLWPLNEGHPCITDKMVGPSDVRFRGVPLYSPSIMLYLLLFWCPLTSRCGHGKHSCWCHTRWTWPTEMM